MTAASTRNWSEQIGLTDPGQDSAPTFDLLVNDKPISDGLRQLIQSIEYEHNDGMADVLKIVVTDPANGLYGDHQRAASDATASYAIDDQRMVVSSLVFQPGNEIAVSFGYHGAIVDSVGRALIRKVRPFFPQNGTPTLEITAYTRDVVMMDNSPAPLKERKTKKARGQTVETDEFKDSKAGRRFKEAKFSDAVIARAEDYGFVPDVDETPERAHDFIHMANMSDYDFVKGISNITGYYFWVDYDFEQMRWVLHFKNPETYVEPQDKTFTFKWAQGQYSTLLEFEPEFVVQGSITELYVETLDVALGRLLSVKVDEPNDEAPDLIDQEANGLSQVEKNIPSAGEVKLYLGDFSVSVQTNRKFRNEEELAAWAQQWFRRQRENFVLSTGRTIGVETLRTRQIHKLAGLGVVYDGEYVFTKVRHIFSATEGYTCEFNARKLLASLPALPSSGSGSL